MTSRSTHHAALSTLFLLLATHFSLLASIPALADDGKPAADDPVLNDAEKKFTEQMTNVVMNGQSTTGKAAPKADKYEIVSVKKIKGDDWQFVARIKFGANDVAIPMTVPVKWAGDTAVISVTDWGLPGLGTYTARVVIYNDTYAGTWQANGANPHGGVLWGEIEKMPAGAAPKVGEAPKK